MATPVVMPQMGESIAEGTIVRWMKKVGDQVDRDEPLFEITTDKVDAEIPAPAAGVLTEIKVKEGETVAVNTVVATIGEQGEASAIEEDAASSAAAGPSVRDGVAAAAASTQQQADGQPQPASATPAPPLQPAAARGQAASRRGSASVNTAREPVDEDRRRRSSPLVRRIARDHVQKSKRSAKAAFTGGRTGIQWAVRRTGRYVRLVKTFVDVIGRVGIVEIEALIEGLRDQEVLAFCADVTSFDDQILRKLILCAYVPLMDIRRLQVAVNRAELERLGDVSSNTVYARRNDAACSLRCAA